jgi:hypothetical protein
MGFPDSFTRCAVLPISSRHWGRCGRSHSGPGYNCEFLLKLSWGILDTISISEGGLTLIYKKNILV